MQKEKEKKQRTQKKITNRKKRSVYGIRDLLFLPLIIGMAFTKDEEDKNRRKTVTENRKKVISLLDDKLEYEQQHITDIYQTYLTEEAEIVLDDDNHLMDNIKQEEYDNIAQELEEIEQEIVTLIIDNKMREDILDLTELDNSNLTADDKNTIIDDRNKAIDEYQQWFEEQAIEEKFYTIKEQEIILSYDVLDKEEDSIDSTILEKEKDDIAENVKDIKKWIANQNRELKSITEKLQEKTKTVERTRIKWELTQQALMENLLFYQAINMAPLNPLCKLVFKVTILNHLFKQSRKVITDEEILPSIDYEKEIKGMLYNNKYINTMIDSALYNTKRLKREIDKEFYDLGLDNPQYQQLLEQLTVVEDDLLNQKDNLMTIKTEIFKQEHINYQKQKN